MLVKMQVNKKSADPNLLDEVDPAGSEDGENGETSDVQTRLLALEAQIARIAHLQASPAMLCHFVYTSGCSCVSLCAAPKAPMAKLPATRGFTCRLPLAGLSSKLSVSAADSEALSNCAAGADGKASTGQELHAPTGAT